MSDFDDSLSPRDPEIEYACDCGSQQKDYYGTGSTTPPKDHTAVVAVVLILLILVMIAATVFMIKLCIGVAGAEPSPNRVKLPAFLQSMLERVPTEELIPDAPQETPETEEPEVQPEKKKEKAKSNKK